MNRRNFLKAFTGAAVGAAVLAVMPPMPEVFAEAVKAPTTCYGTLADLEAFIIANQEKLYRRLSQESPFFQMIRHNEERIRIGQRVTRLAQHMP